LVSHHEQCMAVMDQLEKATTSTLDGNVGENAGDIDRLQVVAVVPEKITPDAMQNASSEEKIRHEQVEDAAPTRPWSEAKTRLRNTDEVAFSPFVALSRERADHVHCDPRGSVMAADGGATPKKRVMFDAERLAAITGSEWKPFKADGPVGEEESGLRPRHLRTYRVASELHAIQAEKIRISTRDVDEGPVFLPDQSDGFRNFKTMDLCEYPRVMQCCLRLSDWLLAIVNNMYFDYCSGLLVVMNAISIGAQTNWMAVHTSLIVPITFRIVELTFCACFAIEIGMRMLAYRLSFFYIHGCAWNYFDMFVVGMQLFEEVLNVIVSSNSNTNNLPNFSFMRILRVLRLVRIMRLVRILRLIRELRTIVLSIVGSMKSLCWTVFLLFLMIYVVGVYLTQLVIDYRVEAVAENRTVHPKIEQYYDTLFRSIMSLYQAITGGLDWNDISDPLVTEISPLIGLVFALYVAFSILALLNVVTGVFVESALKSAKEDSDNYMMNHARNLFYEASGQNAKLSWAQFEAQVGKPQMQEFFKYIGVDVREARSIFHLIDVNSGGEIDLDEFLNGCIRLTGPAKAIDVSCLLLSAAKTAEEQKSHYSNIQEILRKFSEVLPTAQVLPTNSDSESEDGLC